MSVVRKIVSSFSSTAGGFFLLSLTAGLGVALYVATAPDSTSAPAHADAIAVPPLVRAVPVTSPSLSPSANVVDIASMALTRPVAAPVLPSNRGARVRQLQKALARAQCYNGPISGIWSDASKDAMRGFAETVNAQLPVDSPDDTLVALVESNDTATCARGRVVSTGTLGSELRPAWLQQARETSSPTAPPPAAVVPQPPVDERTMLDRSWAPAEMLMPPKEAVAAIAAPDEPRAPAAAVTTNNSASTDDPAARTSSAIHFEDDKAPALQSNESSTPASASDTEAPVAQPTKPKKTKTAKRKPSQYDDAQTSISKGFNTLQRSLSSMF